MTYDEAFTFFSNSGSWIWYPSRKGIHDAKFFHPSVMVLPWSQKRFSSLFPQKSLSPFSGSILFEDKELRKEYNNPVHLERFIFVIISASIKNSWLLLFKTWIPRYIAFNLVIKHSIHWKRRKNCYFSTLCSETRDCSVAYSIQTAIVTQNRKKLFFTINTRVNLAVMFANKVSAGKRYDSTMSDCRITSNKHMLK